MNHLIAKSLRQQIALVNRHARGRARARQQQVRHDAWIILMPMAMRNVRLQIASFGLPARAGHFIEITEVAKLHHVVDAHASVAIVVVVRLPQRAKGIDRHLVIISEVVGEHLHLAAIGIAPQDHSTAIGLAGILHLVAGKIDYRPAIPIPEMV